MKCFEGDASLDGIFSQRNRRTCGTVCRAQHIATQIPLHDPPKLFTASRWSRLSAAETTLSAAGCMRITVPRVPQFLVIWGALNVMRFDVAGVTRHRNQSGMTRHIVQVRSALLFSVRAEARKKNRKSPTWPATVRAFPHRTPTNRAFGLNGDALTARRAMREVLHNIHTVYTYIVYMASERRAHTRRGSKNCHKRTPSPVGSHTLRRATQASCAGTVPTKGAHFPSRLTPTRRTSGRHFSTDGWSWTRDGRSWRKDGRNSSSAGLTSASGPAPTTKVC